VDNFNEMDKGKIFDSNGKEEERQRMEMDKKWTENYKKE